MGARTNPGPALSPETKDKVALVTGANHGIGAATARAFAHAGAAVYLTYLRLPLPAGTGATTEAGEGLYRAWQALPADEVLAAIREEGGRAEASEADLVDPATIPLLFDRVEAVLGPVDVLVNNAAYCVSDTFLPERRIGPDDRSAGGFAMRTITAESHDRHFAVNSRAVALMIAEFARRYLERGATWGRIVNISTDGASAFPGEISYGASKHALESYSRAAAVELGPFGITVNIVAPGPIQTGWITPELEGREVPTIPLRRVGKPADVADVVVWLASEQARFITGQLLYAGGGHVMPL